MDRDDAYWKEVSNNVRAFNKEYTQYKNKEANEDTVNHPSHYMQGSIEVIDMIESAVTGLEPFEAVLVGNAMKYLCRWKHKNGVEDLQKAIWYINKLIEYNSGE